MTTIRFTATQVEIIPATGFIGFADDDTRHYLWLQPEETADGFSKEKEGIWIERDDQRYGGAGGKWSIKLTSTSFALRVVEMPWMECDAVEIEFSVDSGKYAELCSLTSRMMLGCSTDLELDE